MGPDDAEWIENVKYTGIIVVFQVFSGNVQTPWRMEIRLCRNAFPTAVAETGIYRDSHDDDKHLYSFGNPSCS